MPGKIRSMTFLLIATSTGMSLWFMVAAVLPDMAAEAGVPETALALLSSAVQAGFVIGALFIAISGIADRLDPRHLLAFCAVSTSLATLALLLVEIGGTTAVALRFLTGALMAGVYPVGMKLAVGWGTRDRGFLVGILVGALTAGKATPYLFAWLGGADWRLVLITGSVIAALGGGMVLLIGLGPHHARAASFNPRAITVAWTDRRIRAAYLGYLGHMWELYVVWAWVAAAAAASYVYQMGEHEAVSLGKLTAFLMILAGAPMCIWAGRFADRIGKARVATLAMVVSGSTAILTAITFGGPVWLTFALMILWGASVVPDSAQFSALVADYAPPEIAGSLLTFQTALGFGLTIITVQWAPWVAETFGWPVLLGGLALGPLFGIIGLRPVFGQRPGD